MTTARTRFFILAEPFGPLDFTICDTALQAVQQTAAYHSRGVETRLVETTGAHADIKCEQRRIRAEYISRLAEQVNA